ncbi:MAG: hypothetical protein ABIP95_05490 [Pelobium sp.]
MTIKLLLLICFHLSFTTAGDDFNETLENTFLVINNNNKGITKIILDQEHKKIKVWESCVPKDCDWGIIKYTTKENEITAVYAMGDIKKQLVLLLKNNGMKMDAEVNYLMDQKVMKTVTYQLTSQKNRLK